jgi:hypothetical protein
MQDEATENAESEEKTEQRKIARLLAQAIFAQRYSEENPDASNKDRRAAFKEVSSDLIKPARKMLKSLGRSGVEMRLVDKDDDDSDA